MTGPDPPPLRVLIVDDEAPARARLRTLLGDCAAPPARVVGEAADAAQARAWLVDGQCDLVLLDIAMPGRNGLALAADLRGDLRNVRGGNGGVTSSRHDTRDSPAIVFVTAYADHAVRAFELDAADYLTKPVRRDRLQATLLRIAQRRAARLQEASTHTLDAAAQAPATIANAADAAVIVVTDRGRIQRLPVVDVLYLRAELKYLTLRTATSRHLLTGTLGEFEQRLGDGFLRIHRNALVARRAVRALERTGSPVDADDGADGAEAADGWSVRLVGIDDVLPVSRRQLAAVRAALTALR